MGCLFLIKSTEIPTGYNPIITHKVKIGQHSGFTAMKMWCVIIYVLVREVKKLRAKTKKFSRVFSRKHEPQSRRFRRDFFI
ncbi:hypothetical protein SJDPG12_04630 [Porphyromonas gingivalis SJD12]|nr:hypothetical protein SJDPG12_04630 [Porphyromonas gingivalis SJD12]